MNVWVLVGRTAWSQLCQLRDWNLKVHPGNGLAVEIVVPCANSLIRNSAVSSLRPFRSEEALGLLQRSRLFFHHRLYGQNAVEAVAVLQKDEYPQHGRYQCRSNARRRECQVEGKDVIQLRRKHRKRERHKEA
jgi:hypothetical protein